LTFWVSKATCRALPTRAITALACLFASSLGRDYTMSLALCPDCKKMISRAATNCPNCGRPVQPDDLLTPEPSKAISRGCLIALAILLVLIFIVFLPFLMETPEQRRRKEDDAVKRSLGLPK
jgi:hypothetical protein